MKPIKVAMIGVGNCASSLVQGVAYYRQNNSKQGLIHEKIGGYGAGDVEWVLGIDVDAVRTGIQAHLGGLKPGLHRHEIRLAEVQDLLGQPGGHAPRLFVGGIEGFRRYRRIAAAQGYVELGLHAEAREELAALPVEWFEFEIGLVR